MCGIAGIVSSRRVVNSSLLEKMGGALHHRGPDDSGTNIFVSKTNDDISIGLSHRRLSIVDLSESGHQPMSDNSGSSWIVFNGEIYNYVELRGFLEKKNYKFRSSSDTEVILASYKEWGTDCLSRFNGMFAFAIFDLEENHVFMARDRAGEKPLFYTLLNNDFAFSSEIKGLLEIPYVTRRIHPKALDCYLSFGYVPGADSILEGINKLPPGHASIYQVGTKTIRVFRYWNLPTPNGYKNPSKHFVDEKLDQLESLLEDSIRRQLLADVPVGLLLSGGVDSSLITALASRSSGTLQTYTISFPGHGKFDESAHAKKVASYFDTAHTELECPPISIELLSTLAQQFDEPIIDSSMIPTFIVSQLVRRHCTVGVGGDGGDELFGGYFHYNRLLWSKKYMTRCPKIIRHLASGIAEKAMPLGWKGRNWLQSLASDLSVEVPLIAGYFDYSSRRKLLGPRGSDIGFGESVWNDRTPKQDDLLQRATRMDFENYLAEDILVKVDRTSMLNSLEIRAPFLDYRIIEFAFRDIPSSLKANEYDRKIILKKLASRVLPPSFDLTRKQGFSIPIDSWLRTKKWSSYFRDVLLSDDTIYEKKYVELLLQRQERGYRYGEKLLALLNFELWRKHYSVTL